MMRSLQFRWHCHGCGNATTAYRDVPNDTITGRDLFACQWCDKTTEVHWTTTITAVTYDLCGHFEEVYATLEEIPNFEFDESDEGEKTIQ